MGPKLFIESEEELQILTKEWKEKLLLQNWVFSVSIVPSCNMTDQNNAGETNIEWVLRCADIKILRKEDRHEKYIMKQPMELVLIHELLHAKFMLMETSTYEATFLDVKNHQLLEDMAKALYMTKYGLPYDWFEGDWSDTDGKDRK